MSGKIDYTKLSNRGLRDLINQHDNGAVDEYTRRVIAGEIPSKWYTVEELEKKYKETGRV